MCSCIYLVNPVYSCPDWIRTRNPNIRAADNSCASDREAYSVIHMLIYTRLIISQYLRFLHALLVCIQKNVV
jgi:hypothetical protein